MTPGYFFYILVFKPYNTPPPPPPPPVSTVQADNLYSDDTITKADLGRHLILPEGSYTCIYKNEFVSSDLYCLQEPIL